jgi:hypothetical protein
VAHLNYLPIVTAGVAVFVFAAIYYTVLAPKRAKLSSAAASARPRPGLMVIELGKSLLVAAVVAELASLVGATNVGRGVALGLALWIAFPVVLLAGSITYENVPWKLGAIHSGDWLGKLVIISVIVTAWR